MTAYPTLDEKLPAGQRSELHRLGLPDQAIDRIEFEIIDLKSERAANSPPGRNKKIKQLNAFIGALDDFSKVGATLSSETKQMIRAHSFGELPSSKTGHPKTTISFDDFFHAATSYRFGATEAADLLRSRGKARRDEPETQRKLAMRVLRVFRAFSIPTNDKLKNAFVVTISVGCEMLGLFGGNPVDYAQYAIEKTSSEKRD